MSRHFLHATIIVLGIWAACHTALVGIPARRAMERLIESPPETHAAAFLVGAFVTLLAVVAACETWLTRTEDWT